MTTSRRWLIAALVAGIAYLLIGRFPVPPTNLQAWRLAAWAASGVVFAVHIWNEHFRERQTPVRTAIHTAVGVAIGGFGLAVFGLIHSYIATSAIGPLWLLALAAWPAVTAIPAFIAAFVATSILARMPRAMGRL